jgi:hypothetical protein
MLQSSVEERFILAQGGLPIAGSFAWVSPSVMEYAPATDLQCSTSYDVTLAAGATDLSGTALAGVGGSSCVAPETCASFTTRSTQQECSTCPTGECVDVLISQDSGCGCAQTYPAPNCNMPTTYCVPCGCPTCPCDYECYFERQQETYECVAEVKRGHRGAAAARVP